MRAVLGKRVRPLLAKYRSTVRFCAPTTAFREANDNLLSVIPARGGSLHRAITTLHELQESVSWVPPEEFAGFESDAPERLGRGDQSDWPILAATLALDCPLWTEDRDFFGTGVATWTSDRVEIYLRQQRSATR
jgi:predicted nucleic acid-binding protein